MRRYIIFSVRSNNGLKLSVVPIKGLNVTTNKPLETMNIPKALGSFFKLQHSETLRFMLTKVAPRKNPITTKVTIKNIPLDCAAITEKRANNELK